MGGGGGGAAALFLVGLCPQGATAKCRLLGSTSPMLVIPEYPPVSAPGRFHAVLSLPGFCPGLPRGISCSPLPPTLEMLSGPLAVTASYLWLRSLPTPELDLRPQLLDLGMSRRHSRCSELTADIGSVPVYHPQWPEHSPCSRRGFWGCRRQGH